MSKPRRPIDRRRSCIGHDHDGVYAPAAHDHDAVYAKKRFIGAKVYLSASVSGGSGTLQFDLEEFNTDSIHSGANPSRLTCPSAGYY